MAALSGQDLSNGLSTQLRRLTADMLAVCSDPGDVPHALDLLNASYATPAAAAARARLKADPAIASLMRERYWGPWPSQDTLASLPPGSLGHAYGHLLADQGLEPLPPPEFPRGADGDDIYLQRRIRASHDVWHAIAGCPTTVAGEAAMNGLTRWANPRRPRSGCGPGDRLRTGAGSERDKSAAGPALGGGLGTAPGCMARGPGAHSADRAESIHNCGHSCGTRPGRQSQMIAWARGYQPWIAVLRGLLTPSPASPAPAGAGICRPDPGR
jgi:hypothetical protein